MKRLWITGYRSYELNIFKDDQSSSNKGVLKKYLKTQLELMMMNFWVTWTTNGNGKMGT